MQTYIGLLRGINVSGHKKIRMADLREEMLSMGLDVEATTRNWRTVNIL
jgi:uncharacterized protein (DUF1697 family)